jgi:pimeloyl-ACP methyl ester carboxylesterase
MNLRSPAATSSARRIRIRYVVLICLLISGLWVIAGILATLPVTGNHTYWREYRAWPGDFGLKAEEAAFLSQDGIPLKGWYIRVDGVSRGTVILAHGINGNRSDMLSRAAALVRHNYNTLLIDLRDHGQSGGDYAGPGFIESRDVLGALKYLKNRGQTGPFAALGHSYGAVAALYAAAQSPDLAAVIADGAFISFEDMVGRSTTLLSRDPERSFWERLGLRLAGYRAAELAVKPIYYLRTGIWLSRRKTDTLVPISRIVNRPILFISGERDEICPPQNARLMFEAARSPGKRLLLVP